CDALSAPGADWNDVSTTPTGSDKYGPYWVIPLPKESGCINVIVRDGTNKLIDSDLRVSFSDFTDRTVSVIAGNSALYDSRADAFRAAFGVALADALNKLVAAGQLKTNPMKGMVAAVSVGIVNGEAICDLEY
ncbi:hypothetical protein LAN31_21120, partial [Mycobacterium tuberculosis]|nr:hypothetical protein [Mycobacterium tuberculosis]